MRAFGMITMAAGVGIGILRPDAVLAASGTDTSDSAATVTAATASCVDVGDYTNATMNQALSNVVHGSVTVDEQAGTATATVTVDGGAKGPCGPVDVTLAAYRYAPTATSPSFAGSLPQTKDSAVTASVTPGTTVTLNLAHFTDCYHQIDLVLGPAYDTLNAAVYGPANRLLDFRNGGVQVCEVTPVTQASTTTTPTTTAPTTAAPTTAAPVTTTPTTAAPTTALNTIVTAAPTTATTFEVTPPSVAGEEVTLPRTGSSESKPAALFGLGLVAAGAGITVLTRRPRRKAA